MMTRDDYRPRRSALYLPASNARAIEKARGLDCDIVILDLEDAVAPETKILARNQAVAAVRDGGFGRRELAVRVNALDTEWGADDLAALRDLALDALLIPKIDGPDDVARYAVLTGAPIWAMVETARAVLRIDTLATAPRLAGLVMGTNDLAKELRAKPGPDRLPFLGFLAASVAAARANGLVALDGVFNAIADEGGLAAECAQGVMFGFDGKTLIHPGQIATCNTMFSPSPDDIAQAQVIVAAFDAADAAGKGAIRVDGAMVERLHLDQARHILATASAISG